MQSALLAIGLVVLAGVWLGLPALASGSFSAHMVMHMGVVAVAAPLIALGVAGRRLDPVRGAPRLFAPVPASIVELVTVWAWHAPVLHHAARHSTLGLVLEQGTFLASGLLVWLSAFGGGGHGRSQRVAAGILALLLTFMHMTLLGALLALPSRSLYGHSGHGSELTALTPLEDQQLGGAIMLLGGFSYLVGGLWLTIELLKEARAQRERLADRGEGQGYRS
jgi:putative membrane protein